MPKPRSSAAIALALLVCGLAFAPARSVEASAFRVSPIRVDFNSRTSSALMSLVNDSSEELRFRISAFQWTQVSGTGEMKLTPTDDITFFPALLSLKPGEERKVRVGTSVKSGAVEKSYRIFFEELPPLITSDQKPGTQVRIITKLGVPIFVAPQSSSGAAQVANLDMMAGKLAFDVRNDGNVHFLVHNVTVTGFDQSGKPLLQKQRGGSYVLAGDMTHFEVPFDPAECSGLSSVTVTVDTDLTPANAASGLTRNHRVAVQSCKP